MEQELKRYLDVGDVAKYLGVSKWMIYKYIEQREIPFIPYGRIIRFDRLAIDQWTEKRTVRAAPQRPARRHRPSGQDQARMRPQAVQLPLMDQTVSMEAPHGNL